MIWIVDMPAPQVEPEHKVRARVAQLAMTLPLRAVRGALVVLDAFEHEGENDGAVAGELGDDTSSDGESVRLLG